ncbi:MAG: GtrA family protein [Alphaproteobacteria bacterium]|nr:GtrA family protein [Alphaproteobacteria bacterium]
MRLVVLYALIAAIATVANIGAQELTVRAYGGPYHVVLSVFMGTGVGLVVKYVLDKAFIFNFRATDAKHDAQTFVLYTAMGLATTAIFWGFEFGFNALFRSKEMRYLGGLIGLALGYWIKYHLDKRYVFREQAS